MRSALPRRTRAAILVVVLVLAAALLLAGRAQRQMRDFEVYWTAGQRVSAGEPLYRADDGHYRFKYLPAFALAVSPLSRLPLNTAKVTWLAISLACLVSLVALSVTSIPAPPVREGLVAALTVVAMAKFYAHELVLGQANLLFAAVSIAGLASLLRRREAAGGWAFGLAALVKPYAVLFLPYLILTGRLRAAAWASVALVLVLCAPVAVYGVEGAIASTMSWWRTASETSVPLLTNADSVSIFAMFAKWIGWGRVAAACSMALLALLGAALAFVLFRRRSVAVPEPLEIGLLLTLIPLATPQGWDYVLLLSTPLTALMLARAPLMSVADRTAFGIAAAVVAFSLFDVMGREAYAQFMAWSTITVCYLVIMTVAVRLRAQRLA